MKAKKEKVVEVEEVKEVVVEKVSCADCAGTGLKDAHNLCPSCEGKG